MNGNIYRSSNIAIFITIVILTIFSGLRLNVGSDYPTYLDLYRQINKDSIIESIRNIPQDSGFVLFQVALKNIVMNQYAIFFASTFFMLTCIFSSLKRASVNLSESFLVYYFMGFYVQSLNSVRQSLAVSLIFLGYSYKFTNKRKSLFSTLMAFSIHASSVLAKIIMFISDKKKFMFKETVVIFSITFLGTTLFSFKPFIKFVSLFNFRYGNYFDGTGAGFGTQLNIYFNIVLLIYLMKISRNNIQFELINYFIISISCLILALSFVTLGRLQSYFSIFLVILVPVALKNRSVMDKLLLYFAMFIYFGFFVNRYNDVVPYQTWFNQ
jgi:hypothetical protein